LSPSDLLALLDRLKLRPAGDQLPPEATRTHLTFLLARIELLTAALREAEPGATTQLAMRLLLSDLEIVAAQFRADTNAVGASIANVIDAADAVLRNSDQ
jgi:hypothetical protein